MPRVTYLGGIPELRKTGTTAVSAVYNYISVGAVGFALKSVKIPYSDVIDVSLVSDGKKKNNSQLNVDYMSNGFKTCAVFSGKDVPALYSSIQKDRQRLSRKAKPIEVDTKEAITFDDDTSVNTQIDVTEELEKYFTLKEKGIITEDEFEAKKAQLLNL